MSAENVVKAQKAFSQYEFMHWLDDLLATGQGKKATYLREIGLTKIKIHNHYMMKKT